MPPPSLSAGGITRPVSPVTNQPATPDGTDFRIVPKATVADNANNLPSSGFDASQTRASGEWVTKTYHVTCWGSDKLFLETYLSAFVVNDKGEPACNGKFLNIGSGSATKSAQFGFSGSLSYTLAPKQSMRILTGTQGTVELTVKFNK